MWHCLVEITYITTSISSNFGRKNCIIIRIVYCRDIEHLYSRPVSFSKKHDPTTLPVQNPCQTVTHCGCICFSLITRASHVLRTPNTAILAINEAIEVKMCFIPKLSLFLKYRSIIKTRYRIVQRSIFTNLNLSKLSNYSFSQLPKSNLMQKVAANSNLGLILGHPIYINTHTL